MKTFVVELSHENGFLELDVEANDFSEILLQYCIENGEEQLCITEKTVDINYTISELLPDETKAQVSSGIFQYNW